MNNELRQFGLRLRKLGYVMPTIHISFECDLKNAVLANCNSENHNIKTIEDMTKTTIIKRDKIISKDDILNIRILLAVTKDVNEFVEAI